MLKLGIDRLLENILKELQVKFQSGSSGDVAGQKEAIKPLGSKTFDKADRLLARSITDMALAQDEFFHNSVFLCCFVHIPEIRSSFLQSLNMRELS